MTYDTNPRPVCPHAAMKKLLMDRGVEDRAAERQAFITFCFATEFARGMWSALIGEAHLIGAKEGGNSADNYDAYLDFHGRQRRAIGAYLDRVA